MAAWVGGELVSLQLLPARELVRVGFCEACVTVKSEAFESRPVLKLDFGICCFALCVG